MYVLHAETYGGQNWSAGNWNLSCIGLTWERSHKHLFCGKWPWAPDLPLSHKLLACCMTTPAQDPPCLFSFIWKNCALRIKAGGDSRPAKDIVLNKAGYYSTPLIPAIEWQRQADICLSNLKSTTSLAVFPITLLGLYLEDFSYNLFIYCLYPKRKNRTRLKWWRIQKPSCL